MTTRAVAIYFGCELGGDIQCSIERSTLAILPRPVWPTPGPALKEGTTGMVDPVDLDIYNEEVKEYMKHHCCLQMHNQQLYAIIWGQVTEMVHAHLESHAGFETIQAQSDGIGLLNLLSK